MRASSGGCGAGEATRAVAAAGACRGDAGLALATDLATPELRPRVVAFMYVMLLIGMFASSLVFGALLADFGPVKLIQVIQGAAALTMILNVIALRIVRRYREKYD